MESPVRLTQTVETTTELELTPTQRAALKQEFEIYQTLKGEMDDAARDLALSKTVLDGLREELGVKSVGFDGYRVTEVSGGTTKSLNLKKLMATFKITPKQLAGFYVEKPKKGHTLVTLPGDEDKAAKAKAAKAKAKAAAPRDARDDDDADDRSWDDDRSGTATPDNPWVSKAHLNTVLERAATAEALLRSVLNLVDANLLEKHDFDYKAACDELLGLQ